MFLLYNILLTFLAPLWVPWMWFRTSGRKEKPNWKQRMGDYTKSIPPRKESKPRIWVHAVSVGEVLAAKPILEGLRKEIPSHEIVLTVTTSSGHQTARDQASDFYDHLLYFPIDVLRFQMVAMQRVRPDVIVIMETELWMNFLWSAKSFGVRTILANGRISDRAYPRSIKLKSFYRPLLAMVDRVLMQTQTDADRVRELGAQNPVVVGNCKFDQAVGSAKSDIERWQQELGIDPNVPTVVVGSARAEEFDLLANELHALVATTQVVIAPRHLERTPELVKAFAQHQIESVLRSNKDRFQSGKVLILDTYGELAEVYSLADVVVVGGGFANLGGQNILQPLGLGKPVVHGKYMQNFRDVAELAVKREASVRVDPAEKPGSLTSSVVELLADPSLRQTMGKAAQKLISENLGASKRYVSAIKDEIVMKLS